MANTIEARRGISVVEQSIFAIEAMEHEWRVTLAKPRLNASGAAPLELRLTISSILTTQSLALA